MKRRQVLLGGAGGAVALAGVSYLQLASSDSDALTAFLHRTFPDARLPAEDEAEFVRRANLHLDLTGAKRKLANVMLSSGTVASLSNYFQDGRLDFQGEVVALFFRSTDYADPAREPGSVSLIGFADPYDMGCSNPLPAFLEQGLNWS